MKIIIRLPEKTKKLWQLRMGITGILFFSLFVGLCFVTVWFIITAILAAILFSALIFWYIPLFHGNYTIEADKKSIVIKSGVFFRHMYIMPYPRLIYIYTFATPADKYCGISSAVLKAARANIFTPEILNSDIERILTLSKEDNREP